MKRVWISIGVVAVLLGAAAAVYLVSQQNRTNTPVNDTSTEQSNSDVVDDEDTSTPTDSTITVTDGGFDKATYTVKAGETVTVKNNSSASVQFSSDDHPTHLKHPELNMDVLLPGESGTFVVEVAGTYGFHDHLNEDHTGTLVVE